LNLKNPFTSLYVKGTEGAMITSLNRRSTRLIATGRNGGGAGSETMMRLVYRADDFREAK
jgi:hypothetical protein